MPQSSRVGVLSWMVVAASACQRHVAIRTLDARALHPARTRAPDHFDVVLHPYPPAQRR